MELQNRTLHYLPFVRACTPRGALFLLVLGLIVGKAAAGPLAYVTHENDVVSVIDTASQKLTATIKFPAGSRLIDLAVSPDGKRLWVSNANQLGMVSIVDTGNNKIVRAVDVDGFAGELYVPGAIAFARDGTQVYVADWWTSAVVVFDELGNRDDRVKTAAGSTRGPCAIAVTPDGKRVYVTDCFSNTVSVINRSQSNAVTKVTVGAGPDSIALSPDGKYAFVMVGTPSAVSVISTIDNKVLASITVENAGFSGIAVSSNLQRAYATGADTSVSVIDISSKTLLKRIQVGREPNGIALTPDGKHAYVANAGSGSISVIELATDTVVASIAVGARPTKIAIVPPTP